MSMTSSRPYVVRALYEWILENDCTPYVLVNAEEEGVDVPAQYVKDGQIVLNISPAAVVDLVIGNDAMYFNGRFGGMPADIYVPMSAVIGIYARENGEGMVFEGEESPWPQPPTEPLRPEPGDKRPSLKVVK